ncbi:MAG: type IV pilin [Thermoplasmatota archaeon]
MSPVIGVILMVAITVVLAAVVLVLVTKLSANQTSEAPTPVMNVDDVNDKLVVLSSSVGADWSRVSVTATACSAGTIIYMGGATGAHENQPAGVTAPKTRTAISVSGCTTAPAPIQVAVANTAITAADFLSFCSGTGAATNVNLQVVDTVANAVLGSYAFTSIAVCS